LPIIESLGRDRLQAISVGMQAYSMKIDLLTNATVVERAVQFVDRNKGFMRQNQEVRIEVDTTESIQNPR
jgi:2,3-bisphosphoglycerate-independent phosphoglycerate mutase